MRPYLVRLERLHDIEVLSDRNEVGEFSGNKVQRMLMSLSCSEGLKALLNNSVGLLLGQGRGKGQELLEL